MRTTKLRLDQLLCLPFKRVDDAPKRKAFPLISAQNHKWGQTVRWPSRLLVGICRGMILPGFRKPCRFVHPHGALIRHRFHSNQTVHTTEEETVTGVEGPRTVLDRDHPQPDFRAWPPRNHWGLESQSKLVLR